jgi:hypothetical protein
VWKRLGQERSKDDDIEGRDVGTDGTVSTSSVRFGNLMQSTPALRAYQHEMECWLGGSAWRPSNLEVCGKTSTADVSPNGSKEPSPTMSSALPFSSTPACIR